MSLSFGLNVKPSTTTTAPPSRKPPKPTIFDSSDSESDDGPSAKAEESITSVSSLSKSSNGKPSKPPARASRGPPSKPPPPLSSRHPSTDLHDPLTVRSSTLHLQAAESLDPSINDYDTYLSSKQAVASSEAALKREDAIARKPKYIHNLVSAAAQRKQDLAVAQEKKLQREREAEGDEFKDSETFVTEAYKRQREENARVEEEEKKKREEEERRRGKGMGGFLRGVLGEQERVFEERREKAERALREGIEVVDGEAETDEVEEARRRGVEVVVNEEGEVADKRQLLSAGLNVGGKGGATGAEHLKVRKGAERENAFKTVAKGDQRGARERQTRMMEEQLAAAQKRKADEEAEERRNMEHAAKSKKTEGEVMSAKERYLARKREKEEAAKKAV
ncbi:L-type lectin-like domain-containing protein [Sphaceloma murrayae]|uniref:L-type lectin-like domain-containing protein n=1 Tax=Sphaceloma murrayae TaxID=2082308 RepID=A0A2K1QQX6_9PEZI|nr:L-type lectin-like domain-containing protein [Sphaceloma murrayae]